MHANRQKDKEGGLGRSSAEAAEQALIVIERGAREQRYPTVPASCIAAPGANQRDSQPQHEREVQGNRHRVPPRMANTHAASGRLAMPTQYPPPLPGARFSKRVSVFRKASFTVPTGPLRCLPMTISVTPGSLLSLL